MSQYASLNSDSHLPNKNYFVCFNEGPLKIAFHFILKSLFVVKIFKFLSWLFGLVEKMAGLERSSTLPTKITVNKTDIFDTKK